MPWDIEQDSTECNSGEYAVVKRSTGELEGCHNTMEEAEAQVTALNIAESEMTKSIKQMAIDEFLQFITGQFEQAFCNEMGCPWVQKVYDSHIIAEDAGKLYRVNYMIANERALFMPREDWVTVEVVYQDKAATLLKEYTKDAPKDTSEKAKTLWARAKEAVKWLFEEPVKHTQETPVDFDEPFGIAVKTVNGQLWHFTWSTNAFLDRDGEIFSTKSLENYVAQNEQKEDKGTFDFWHIPNTDFATKEWQAVVGRFLLEAGPYIDNEIGQRAKAFFQQYPDGHPTIAPEGWGASPEFEYDPMDRMDGVYDWIDIVKTSTLPRGKAANLYTKGSQVIMNDEQRKAAIAVFGEEFVNQNEKAALAATSKLEESLAFKAKEKADPQEETPKETPKEVNPQEQTQVNFDEKALEELGKIISRQLALDVDIAPLQEQVETLTKEMDGLKEELNQLKEQKETKEEAETPRYIFNLMQRASEAKGSEVAENDELRQRKPKQTETKFGVSGAIFGNQ